MAILLIRHGETALNVARIVQHPGTPLSARGVEQARRLGARLAALEIGGVLSSDFLRSRMTAHAVAAATGARITETEALRERSMGELEGRRHADLGLDFHAPEFAPPGGEGPGAFASRVADAWGQVVEAERACDGDLAVVTHGLVCHALARAGALGARALEAPPVWANTSLTVVEGGPPWSATTLACVAHLEGDAAISGAA